MIRSLILAALCCVFFLIACKKGQDDPAISLASRKARMAGSWELMSGSLKVDDKRGNLNQTFQYDLTPTVVTVTVTASGSSTVFVASYSLKLNMTKNGNFDFDEKVGNIQLKASGRWSFNSGIGESKKKADVIYIIEEVQSGATGDLSLFNKLNTNFEYFIRELRSKKLVLETSSYVHISANGDFQGIEGNLVFEQ